MAITMFFGEYRFLSNFSPAFIWYEAQNYPTVEHAYVAAKTLDKEKRADIARMTKPGDAKRAGRLMEVREDWDDVKLGIMHMLLRLKFEDPELKAKLLATGDELLVEGNNWHDGFWGTCRCDKCGAGKNHLGRLLMQVREEYQS